jgi:HlyD family secretion protein
MIRNAIIILLVAMAATGAAWYGWYARQARLPDTITYGNGRLEAEEVQIATKIAGRLAGITVDEGDWVTAGQVVAHMDTAELDAARRGAAAQSARAREGRAEVEALIAQRKAELQYADAELRRATVLARQGNIARDLLEQRQSQRDVGQAALNAATAQFATSERTIEAADAEVARIDTQIADSTLTTPIDGRVQYRLVHAGEVLPAGGRVATLLDLTDVHMTIFLPTRDAGRVFIGSEARIVFDAAPEYVVPAKVTFVAAEAQFTPKEVETRSERDKLMFRVKVTIAPELLRAHIEKVKTGLPATAYVHLGNGNDWPSWLAIRLPDISHATAASGD